MTAEAFESAAAAAACRGAAPKVAALPHVVAAVSAFLDASALWELDKAVESGSPRLIGLVAAALQRSNTPNQWWKQYRAQLAMRIAARKGLLDVMKSLHNLFHCKLDRRMVDAAARGGHLDIGKWLYANAELGALRQRRDFLSYDAVSIAALGGNLEFLQLIFSNSTERSKPSIAQRVLKHTCANGNLDITKWILYQAPLAPIATTLDAAAGSGHLDILRALHDHSENFSLDVCTTDAMDQAACNGHFEVVRFLHEHRTEGCTKKAMDKAATHGHLDIVRFLHENRSEGCSTRAMDGAAAHGHLDVLKFLHANRSEGCTKDAMRIAATRNFIDVVEWLHANTNAHCCLPNFQEVTDIAAQLGDLGILGS